MGKQVVEVQRAFVRGAISDLRSQVLVRTRKRFEQRRVVSDRVQHLGQQRPIPAEQPADPPSRQPVGVSKIADLVDQSRVPFGTQQRKPIGDRVRNRTVHPGPPVRRRRSPSPDMSCTYRPRRLRDPEAATDRVLAGQPGRLLGLAGEQGSQPRVHALDVTTV